MKSTTTAQVSDWHSQKTDASSLERDANEITIINAAETISQYGSMENG